MGCFQSKEVIDENIPRFDKHNMPHPVKGLESGAIRYEDTKPGPKPIYFNPYSGHTHTRTNSASFDSWSSAKYANATKYYPPGGEHGTYKPMKK